MLLETQKKYSVWPNKKNTVGRQLKESESVPGHKNNFSFMGTIDQFLANDLKFSAIFKSVFFIT